jgi:Fic family protein
MIRVEQKNIKNKGFYYLTERFNTGEGFKKIQVYIGKNVPNHVSSFYRELKEKEKELVKQYQPKVKGIGNEIIKEALYRVEEYKLDWKYFIAQKTEQQKRIIFRYFAIRFIFESNSIEGSRLTENEVLKIVKKEYVKKSLPAMEVQEVYNSIEAFDFIRSGSFRLNQKYIKKLYLIITKNLGYETGFKTQNNTVNNKNTVSPENVKEELKKAITWYDNNKKEGNPFMNAVIFHNKFEYVHPFRDGNGRTGRMILIWMLIQTGYDVLLYKKKNMEKYFSSLDEGDEGRYKKIITHSADAYKETVQELTI